MSDMPTPRSGSYLPLRHRIEIFARKIRDAEVKKIPYMLIVGEKEMEEGLVSVRRHGQGDLGSMKVEEFENQLVNEIKI